MIKFNETYTQLPFLEFLKEFLPDFEKDIRKVDVSDLKVVGSAFSLGKSSLLDLQVFEIHHNSSSSARVALATDGFRLMKQTAIYRALVVFHSDDSKEWRLSLMTLTPEKNEKGGVSVQVSNPRRYSFLLGESAKVNTPHKFLISKGKVSDFSELTTRFSIEVVNKEFYSEIAELFTELVGGTRSKNKTQKTYPGLIELPSISKESHLNHEFAVRLIGRLIFCWFLKEKKSDSGLPLIPGEVLSGKSFGETDGIYHSVLEPLFFEILNKKVEVRKPTLQQEPYKHIPYLNGGLFSPQTYDYYKDDYKFLLKIPDEWIRKFVNVLELYNFTIDENTSVDIDLSVDPEMLGRIFENLLAEINPETGESARKSTGSYYTPREIVEYMVNESLIQYLKDKTGISEEKLRATASYDLTDDEQFPLEEEEKKNVIEALGSVKILDPACGSGAFPIGALQKIVFILQRMDPDAHLWFKKQIASTPPELRNHLEKEYEQKNLDYIRKLGIIRECIYGVDIQPIATEIARLRCFLTLVVDERVIDNEYNRGIVALPNLDFKFVTANSLVGLPTENSQTSQSSLLQSTEDTYIERLKQIRDDYFNSSNHLREQLKIEFYEVKSNLLETYLGNNSWNELTKYLSTWDPFGHEASSWFNPDWMFGVKNGFDIIIANPPYVGQKGNNALFKPIKESAIGEFHQRRMDLFYFFFHFSLNVGKDMSIILLITTNYYPTATYADKLRKDIKSRSTIKSLIDFNEMKIFESALGQHNMITILKKGKDQNHSAKTCITHRSGLATPEILHQILSGIDIDTHYYNTDQENLFEGNDCYIRIEQSKGLSNNSIQTALDKLRMLGKNLSDVCDISTGVQTGADKVTDKNIEKYNTQAKVGEGIFVLSEDEATTLKLKGRFNTILKPWFKNSSIYKWGTEISSKETLIYYTNKETNDLDPAVISHFKKYKDILINRNTRSGTGVITNQDYDNFVKGELYISYVMISSSFKKGRYYCISYARDNNVFNSEKIVVPQRSPSNTFGYNEIPWYASADVYFITQKDKGVSLKYILTLLNSKIYYFWLYYRGKRKGETLELYQRPLSEIPIKVVSPEKQQDFVVIADKILSIIKDTNYQNSIDKQADVKVYEKQIDQMIYKLYGLNNEEIEIIEGKRQVS